MFIMQYFLPKVFIQPQTDIGHKDKGKIEAYGSEP